MKYENGALIPQQGTLYTKDKKSKLEYYKKGNDYAFSVYDVENNPVKDYTRSQYKKRGDNEVLMTYNQFINYLYAEMYIDDKYAKGGATSKFKIYHETLSEALDEAERYVEANGYHFTEDRYFPDVTNGGIRYGETKSISRDLGGKRKNTLLAQIYRMDSGRYELNMYFAYEGGGEMDVRIEDTVQRMDDPHFADISYYAKGGLSDKKTLEQVADKHGLTTDQLQFALNQGIKIEMEHTQDRGVAEKIALDHLYESPVYYTYLQEMEEQIKQDMKKEMAFKEISDHYGIDQDRLNEEYHRGIYQESLNDIPYDSVCQLVLIKMKTEPNYYTAMQVANMEAEGDKLEGYYAEGGDLGESCQIFTPNGERAIDPQSIKTLTKCVNDLPQTKTMHFDFAKGDYTPERKQLHKEIIKKFKKEVYCIKEGKQPIAILMGGSPASGKSTFVNKFAPYLLTDNLLKIDADEIRSKLPEYQGYNATQTHLETKDIVNTLLSDRNIGVPCKFDLLYDGTMNNTKSYTPLINLLKSLGYKVFIIYIDRVPYSVVKERALKRYQKRGRFVPLEVIDDFFEKGTEALEKLKKEVDGYIVVDGSTPEYRLIERGGKEIPKLRNYEEIGEKISIDNQDIIKEFANGGEIQPDKPAFKNMITHKSGSAGGMLVGKRHSEGGIKALNKSTGQPLEMEGGEVVITRNAVSDNKKRMFEGKMMTNREILSKINESGGGVSFASGGDVPEKCACKGHSYKYGGTLLKDFDIVKSINNDYDEKIQVIPDINDDLFMKNAREEDGFVIYDNKYVPTFDKYREKGFRGETNALLKGYKDYLYKVFKFTFDKLPMSVQIGLLINHKKNLDSK